MNKHAVTPSYGKVYFVGAGPGAADLISVRGARLLAQADVVLHDALVHTDMLALAPQAEKIAVGKRCAQPSVAQATINQWLVDCAARYRIVVRLKGGDPMLFGRIDEELHTLEAHGISSEIVPGITAACAAAAVTQQPLSKRGVARSVAFFTSATAALHGDVPLLPNSDTLVQYMGARQARATARRLIAQGRSPELPVVIVENASLPEQSITRMHLRDLEHGLATHAGPVVVMIGEAMALRGTVDHDATDAHAAYCCAACYDAAQVNAA